MLEPQSVKNKDVNTVLKEAKSVFEDVPPLTSLMEMLRVLSFFLSLFFFKALCVTLNMVPILSYMLFVSPKSF